MERRRLGRTGLEVGRLGFGCGAVGGLMVRGAPADQERAVARALELGVTYFDTAPSYGDGESERNLGRVLRALRADPCVGTKLRIEPGAPAAAQAAASLDASLSRLGRERVDLLQLHNPIGVAPDAAAVLGEIRDALDRQRAAGKVGHIGITAIGDTAALHRVVDAGSFDTAQVVCNLLNPSAALAQGAGQDYGRLLDRMERAGMGAIGIRALAGGALSGSVARHPLGARDVAPIGSGTDYGADAAHARRLDWLVREGFAASLPEAGLRFLAGQKLATILVGCSTLDQLETAARALAAGPLPPEALARLGLAVAGQLRA